jgi:hypothetical protein
MQEELHKRLHAPELGPCVCSQVRRLARKLSSLLSPEDLTITQYSLLATIERTSHVPSNPLLQFCWKAGRYLGRTIRALLGAVGDFFTSLTDSSPYQQVSLGREVTFVITPDGPLIYRWGADRYTGRNTVSD